MATVVEKVEVSQTEDMRTGCVSGVKGPAMVPLRGVIFALQHVGSRGRTQVIWLGAAPLPTLPLG